MPDAKLFCRCYYNYSDLELKVMKKWLIKELKYNKIKPSKLFCASTILMVKKLYVDPEDLRSYVNY